MIKHVHDIPSDYMSTGALCDAHRLHEYPEEYSSSQDVAEILLSQVI